MKPNTESAKVLSVAERKARVEKLVAEGKLTPAQAELIDYREAGPKQRAAGGKLLGKGRLSMERGSRAA